MRPALYGVCLQAGKCCVRDSAKLERHRLWAKTLSAEEISMSAAKWNELGRVWEEDHGLLDDEQVGRCQRADVAEPPSPVPTRMISNGEYMPAPQTAKQRRVESRLSELSDAASKKLGVSRRHFLAGSGGMAAALLAMNEAYGNFLSVNESELY